MASRPGAPSPPRGGPSLTARSVTDPVLRNALRYTISAREYATLHKYIISRSRALKRRAPTPAQVQRIIDGPRPKPRRGQGRRKESGEDADTEEDEMRVVVDDYSARAIRHSIRVFVASGALMKLWDLVSARLTGKKKEYVHPGKPTGLAFNGLTAALSFSTASTSNKKQPLHKSPTLRLSLSLSTILLLYRILFRFFTRLRAHLLDPSAAPFRLRNPRTASTLTSPYAPAIGASLAGLALGVYPNRPLRATIGLYALFRALEFGWNCAEDNGMIWGWEAGTNGKPARMRERPAWWGSWMLQPFAIGQLMHALVFDRDCLPSLWSEVVLKGSGTYLQPRPEGYPAGLQWPKPGEIVDSLAQMAKLGWP
jgi:hypothetical protein